MRDESLLAVGGLSLIGLASALPWRSRLDLLVRILLFWNNSIYAYKNVADISALHSSSPVPDFYTNVGKVI